MKWEMIKFECLKQNYLFKLWDNKQIYTVYHRSHYDWWAFPVDTPSRHGSKYQIGPQQLTHLSKDTQFMEALRTNCILVCKSWGYNLVEGREYQQIERKRNQQWQQWPIRLYKMTNSLELFKQEDLFKNAVLYGNLLIQRKHNFVYRDHKLDQYFVRKQPVVDSL